MRRASVAMSVPTPLAMLYASPGTPRSASAT